MKTIKVIDLYNMIAKGEIPKHIRKDNMSLWWNEKDYAYDIQEKNIYAPFYLFKYDELNDEVEIIEEPKKIEKTSTQEWNCMRDDYKIYHLKHKLDEIIDYLMEDNNAKN